MKRRTLRITLLTLTLLVLLFGIPLLVLGPPSLAGTRRTPPGSDPGPGKPGTPPAPPLMESVLLTTPKPYAAVVAEIERQGGVVTQQYKYFDGVAARVPRSALAAILAITGPESIKKDVMIEAPDPRDLGLTRAGAPPVIDDGRSVTADAVDALAAGDLQAFAASQPEGYIINDGVSHASALHAAGITGIGVIVALIDSGIRPGYPHLTSDGSVIGGEDFVLDGLGFSHQANSGHGTFVAGMVSANTVFRFFVTSLFFRSVRAYAPGAIMPPNVCIGGSNAGAVCTGNGNCPGGGGCGGAIPMVGSAPHASIYALRVFGPAGGAPTSRILQAVDRAIELKELYRTGMPGGRNIQVVNMSLGGPNLFPGRELLDRGVSALLDHDIVAVVSASNAGPSGLTIGGPGSAMGAVTVGAASLPHAERIVRDLQFGFGIGAFYRPFGGVQTVYFSSRGPNPDGRGDPDVIANGDWCYGQGFAPNFTAVSFAGGTSFSSPTVAGVAALLREAVPSATARQVRNAIIAAANPGVLADGSTALDQGAGYVDALAARDLLLTGTVPDDLPAAPPYTHKLRDNLEDNAGLTVLTGTVAQHVGPLKPGERGELFYLVQPNTAQVRLTLSNVTPSLPPAEQNLFFGDDVLITVHSAKTTRHTNAFGDGDYQVFAFTNGGSAVLTDPETGIMRITVNGDWTNAGEVSADVAVSSVTDPTPRISRQGKVSQSEFVYLPITIPPGVSEADFRLVFREEWSNYPVSDIDMILIPPDFNLLLGGATLNAPERVVVNNPMPGEWTVVIQGFELHVPDDRVELRVSLDGVIVR